MACGIHRQPAGERRCNGSGSRRLVVSDLSPWECRNRDAHTRAFAHHQQNSAVRLVESMSMLFSCIHLFTAVSTAGHVSDASHALNSHDVSRALLAPGHHTCRYTPQPLCLNQTTLPHAEHTRLRDGDDLDQVGAAWPRLDLTVQSDDVVAGLEWDPGCSQRQHTPVSTRHRPCHRTEQAGARQGAHPFPSSQAEIN